MREARALTQQARAAYFPSVERRRRRRARRGRGRQFNGSGTSVTGGTVQQFYNLALDASWELDLWGRVRRNVESSEASAQASVADLEAARLSAQAELAQDYLLLRVQDAQIDLLATTVGGLREVAAADQQPVRRRRRRRSDVVAGRDAVQGDAGAGARRRASRARSSSTRSRC